MLLWKYAFELRESKTKYVLEGMEAVLRLVLCPPLPSCPGRNSHSAAPLTRGSVTVESSLPHKDVHFPSAVWPAQALSGVSQDSCGPAKGTGPLGLLCPQPRGSGRAQLGMRFWRPARCGGTGVPPPVQSHVLYLWASPHLQSWPGPDGLGWGVS